jgi:hypothetical protein
MDKPNSLTSLLHNGDFPAGEMLKRGRFLNRLNNLVQTLLDDDLKIHCQVGNIRDGVLILYTDSTAWASRLRYQSPALLKQMQQHKGLASLQQIEIRVQPREEKVSIYRKAELSNEASSCLQACADGMTDNGLKQALERLASHHKLKD